jgi:exonuclease III
VASIIGLDTDIILLSDIRLSNKLSLFLDLFKLRYRCIINSTKAKRGVAILYKNELNLKEISRFSDPEENFILLNCYIKDYEFLIGSVYGPNDDNGIFFENLQDQIRKINCQRIILGGDWNLTPSADPVEYNKDIFRMRAIPSAKRSEWFNKVSENCDLVDIFRIINTDTCDYTYVPFGKKNTRSRIDFFAVSDSLIDYVNRCESSPNYCKKYFDHKPVILEIGKKFKKYEPRINNRVLGHPLLKLVVTLAIYECYLRNRNINRYGPEENEIYNLCCSLDEINGRVDFLMDFCSPWDWSADLGAPEIETRDANLLAIRNLMQDMMSLDQLSVFPKTVGDDEFFELLIKATKNSTLDLQKKALIMEKKDKKILTKELTVLSKNYSENIERIQVLEQKISDMVDLEMRDKVSNYLKTDILNSEKITPRFLSIARATNTGTDTLEQICDSDGKIFMDPSERSKYIEKFYKELYDIPENLKNKDLTGCIENFLGEEICNNPTVRKMKISQEEKERLDGPFTLEELDRALEDSNMKSAPGIDGINNKFIKLIWHMVRVPLLKYAECCFEKKQLTETLNTACIKLIPKKGDLKQIKNWRPISLLSCYYKIISRVINHRLGSVIDKVTSRGQKAYNSKRYIQEVILNLNGAANYCINTGKSGLIMSIDQQKAFDTVLHDFCNEAYRFFGFGEKFISMMSTLGNNREAKIMLEDGSMTNSFKLKRGRPQGDSPSPRQYNIAMQIFILKIEFDPRIKKVHAMSPIQRPLQFHAANARISPEILDAGTEKSEIFADDANIVTTQDYDCVLSIKQIMDEFYEISGLKCNIDKTSVMFIGPDNEAEQAKIRSLGFLIVTEIKCLGFVLKNTGGDLNHNFDVALTNVRRIAGEWSRFNLTLHGRLAISKTFLLSQLTYFGAVISPTKLQVNNLQSVIDNFILRGTPWSRKFLYTDPDKGGLGAVNVSDFLDSLKCIWFKRIAKEGVVDNWRFNLLQHCFFNPICFRPDQLTPERPLEFNIGTAFWRFAIKYWTCGKNILSAPIIKNPLFFRGLGDDGRVDTRQLDENILGNNNFEYYKEQFLKLCVADCLNNNGFKSYADFLNDTGTMVTPNVYLAIRKSVVFTIRKFNVANSTGTNRPLVCFLREGNKNSKPFRRILGMAENADNSLGKKLIQNYCNIIEIPVPESTDCYRNIGFWSTSFLPVRVRDFALKLLRNSVPVNARLAGRYRNNNEITIDERCRHCLSAGPDPTVIARETFSHFFWECGYTSKVLELFKTKYLSNLSGLEFKNFIFLGLDPDSEYCIFYRLLSILLLFEIWENGKERKFNRSFATIESNMLRNFDSIFLCSKKIKTFILSLNNVWCRTWWPSERHRHG